MQSDFKYEIDLISSNSKINDKVILFLFYCAFYNEMLESKDSYIKNYSSFMKNTFDLLLESINMQKRLDVDIEQFINTYFKKLKDSRLYKYSNLKEAKEVFELYETGIEKFFDEFEYARHIDNISSISLDDKLDVVNFFEQLVNNICIVMIQLCGDETTKELRYDIFIMLKSRLIEYLNELGNQNITKDVLCENIKSCMMNYTKEFLFNKLECGEFGFDIIQNEKAKEYYTSFDSSKQRLWLIALIYAICGYNTNEKSEDLENMEEICALLGVTSNKHINLAIALGNHLYDEFYNTTNNSLNTKKL